MSGEAILELVFMMVILKIPVVYLAVVVYWAVRAEPRPLEPAPLRALPPDRRGGPSDRLSRGRRARPRPAGPRPRPHGGPVRTYARRVPALRAGAD